LALDARATVLQLLAGPRPASLVATQPLARRAGFGRFGFFFGFPASCGFGGIRTSRSISWRVDSGRSGFFGASAMPNDFHVVNFVTQLGRVGYDVGIVIPPDDLSGFVTPPERDENGKFNVVMLQPTDQTRHVALGMFMDAWSKLELAISDLLMELLSTSSENMPALMNSLGTRGQIDVISVLGQSALTGSQATQLIDILQSIKTNSTRRNHIVHGYWLLEMVIRDHGGRPAVTYNQYRAYDPSDPKTALKVKDVRNSKERSKYLFSIARIDSITREIGNIMARVQALTGTLRKRAESVQKQVNLGV
jgi:hypothetical protein